MSATHVKAIIFDVDGTLADTEDAHRRSFNKAFDESSLNWHWDIPLYDKLLKTTGGKERIKHYVETCQPAFNKPMDYDGFVKKLHQLKTVHYTTMLQEGGIPLRPNIQHLVAEARAAGLRLAIATTTSPENVAALLQQAWGATGKELFEVIGCGEIVPHKKPAPDIYFWVLEQLGLNASECVALEDSENGLRASLAAGVRTFITTNQYTRTQDFTGAEAVFEDLGDLNRFYIAANLPHSKAAISV